MRLFVEEQLDLSYLKSDKFKGTNILFDFDLYSHKAGR